MHCIVLFILASAARASSASFLKCYSADALEGVELADGQVNPHFKNFGLAWYQTDVQADGNGDAEVAIKTILLDQIFGFSKPRAPLV